MNKIASPCCGSCRHWNGINLFCEKHNDHAHSGHFSCGGEDYIPVNPIPLITVPGVKEMVKEAWLAGAMKGGEWSSWAHEQRAFDEYMKVLEAGNG